jgi:predicted O-linked N-acetylglucosamine transferase (SPINDLY family)
MAMADTPKQPPASPPAARTFAELADLATARHGAGDLAGAVDAYRDLLAIRPTMAAVWNNMGAALKGLGRSELAIDAYAEACRHDPNAADAPNNMADILNVLGRHEEAETAARRSIQIQPDLPQAWSNLCVALMGQYRYDEAVTTVAEAIRLKPDYHEAHCNHGATLQRAGRLDEAIAPLQRAIALCPDFAPAHANLGRVYLDMERYEESIAECQRAIALRPDDPDASYTLAGALANQKKWGEAAEAHRRLSALAPDFLNARAGLALILNKLHDNSEVLDICRTGLAKAPDDIALIISLGDAHLAMGNVEEGIKAYRQASQIDPNNELSVAKLAMAQYYCAGISGAERLDLARLWADRFTPKPDGRRFDNDRDPDRRLRIGYVSGDFYNHPVAFFLTRVLAAHNSAQVETFCYATNKDCTDENSEQIQNLTDHWRMIAGVSDDDAIEQIRQDGIDILVDLSGNTAHNRLKLFARRAAPVQLSWLGYCGTTGIPAMDYILADHFIVPVGEEEFFTETVWRLPGSYLCFDPPEVNVAVGDLPARSGRGVTFGCFNNLVKIVDPTLDLWAKVLHACPDSRMLIKTRQLKSEATRQSMLERFAARGIGPERLIMEGYVRSRLEHLDSYNRVDIALDTLPYGGGTTTAETLWMGVPLVTLRGDSWVGRISESILSAVGLPQLVAKSPEEYVGIAAGLAASPDLVATLRASLRAFVMTSTLCNGAAFAQELEAAYRGMWQKWCARPVVTLASFSR